MRYLPIFLLLTLMSCKQKEAQSQQFKTILPKNIDTTRFREYQSRFNASLQLNDISTGVDSFEIRISYNLALVVEKDLFIFRYIKGNWKGLHYAYQRKKDNDSLDFVQREFAPLIPWENFIDSIYSSQILKIPSQVDLINYRNRVADGKYFSLDYATKAKFKTITYENPQYYPEFQESQLVLDFIAMFYRNIHPDEICWPKRCK